MQGSSPLRYLSDWPRQSCHAVLSQAVQGHPKATCVKIELALHGGPVSQRHRDLQLRGCFYPALVHLSESTTSAQRRRGSTPQ